MKNPSDPQLTRLRGYAMNAANPCAKDQFYGEYLHAFEDTFAHRDATNQPYESDLGHLSGGHQPDNTYNANGWTVNADRTIEMEQEVFQKLQKDFGTAGKDDNGNAITWDAIKATMVAFNADTSPETNLVPKKAIFNRLFKGLGSADIVDYSCSKARDLRNESLKVGNGSPLKQENYPGAILATPTKDESCN